jgi:DNA-binding winged-HTH domains
MWILRVLSLGKYMIYVINDYILFRDDDGVICCKNNVEDINIVLTVTTSRLLSYLLARQGDVVTRDDILENVWETYGLRSSSNSLNKYISDLRTVFRNMGCDENIIVTVPRVGFIIPEEINVSQRKEKTAQFQKSKNLCRKKNVLTIICTFISILSISLLIILFRNFGGNAHKQNNAPPVQETNLIGVINNCNIMALKPLTPNKKDILLSLSTHLIKNHNLICIPNSVFYFQVADAVLSGTSGRVFIARCIYSNKEETLFSACSNIYEADYEIKK